MAKRLPLEGKRVYIYSLECFSEEEAGHLAKTCGASEIVEFADDAHTIIWGLPRIHKPVWNTDTEREDAWRSFSSVIIGADMGKKELWTEGDLHDWTGIPPVRGQRIRFPASAANPEMRRVPPQESLATALTILWDESLPSQEREASRRMILDRMTRIARRKDAKDHSWRGWESRTMIEDINITLGGAIATNIHDLGLLTMLVEERPRGEFCDFGYEVMRNPHLTMAQRELLMRKRARSSQDSHAPEIARVLKRTRMGQGRIGMGDRP